VGALAEQTPLINIVNVGYDSTNYYVLASPNIRLLIDVGWPGARPKLVANLRRKDIPLAAINYLLITPITPAWPKQPKQTVVQ